MDKCLFVMQNLINKKELKSLNGWSMMMKYIYYSLQFPQKMSQTIKIGFKKEVIIIKKKYHMKSIHLGSRPSLTFDSIRFRGLFIHWSLFYGEIIVIFIFFLCFFMFHIWYVRIIYGREFFREELTLKFIMRATIA